MAAVGQMVRSTTGEWIVRQPNAAHEGIDCGRVVVLSRAATARVSAWPMNVPVLEPVGSGCARSCPTTRMSLYSPAALAVGIDGLVPHGLRHTTASLAISAGANVKVVQSLRGHATAAMTPDWYGHLSSDLTGVAEALGRAIESTAVSLRSEKPQEISEAS
jgi:integrase